MRKSIIVFVITLLMTALGASAKEKNVQKVYIFGFAASFNDSTVYFTDIQQIDSAWVEAKKNFLLNRESYSYQLRDYLAEQGEKNRTCITCFALERKDIDKKYLKLKSRYTKNGEYDVKTLAQDQFKYEAIEPTEVIEQEAAMDKKTLKAKRKELKAKNKEVRKLEKQKKQQDKKQAKQEKK